MHTASASPTKARRFWQAPIVNDVKATESVPQDGPSAHSSAFDGAHRLTALVRIFVREREDVHGSEPAVAAEMSVEDRKDGTPMN